MESFLPAMGNVIAARWTEVFPLGGERLQATERAATDFGSAAGRVSARSALYQFFSAGAVDRCGVIRQSVTTCHPSYATLSNAQGCRLRRRRISDGW